MLTAIRENSKGWIAGIIIGAIILTFALFGISSYLEGANEVPVATINGEEISAYDYQNALARQRQLLVSQLGANFDPALLESMGVRQQVVNGLIGNQVLSQYMADQNYRVTDEQLSEAIRTNPSFQVDGKFDPQTYRNLLASNGLSTQGYEAGERRTSINRQLRDALNDTAFVAKSEIDQLISLREQSRVADYAIIPANRFVAETVIPDNVVREDYDQNIDNYQAPARVKVDYIELSVAELAKTIEPSDLEIEDYWEQTKGKYKTAESRRASHILFSVKSSASDEDKQSIRSQAETVLAEAEAGTDFSELAETHSEDPGSKSNGGDLGVVTAGQMVKPFEEAVFDMQQDEIRGLVETRFGFHIIKLTELTLEQQQSLADVREQVVTELSRQQAENLFAELGDSFQTLVYEEENSLQASADELGLELQTSDWFTEANGVGIAQDAVVRRAAFTEDVLQDGLNSQTIEIGFDRMIALRKNEYETAAPRPFEDVAEDIRTRLTLEASAKKVTELGESILQQLGSEKTWDDLTSFELQSTALPESKNDIPPALRALGDAVYATELREEGKPTISGLPMTNGDYALYALKSVTLGDPETVDESAKQRIEQQLLSRDGNLTYNQFSSLLRELAEVVIDEDLVNSDRVEQGNPAY